ncbi:MAG: response regulator [Gaiellaceae bacterium]
MRDRVAYEALELAEQHPFDLLLTDVVMPGLSGPETASQLREQTPGPARALHVRLCALEQGLFGQHRARTQAVSTRRPARRRPAHAHEPARRLALNVSLAPR